MKKIEIVKENKIFNDIIAKGKKKSNEHFAVFFMENNESHPKFGVAASKKLGDAVTRNRLKRQTRALIDDVKYLFKNNANYIIIIKEAAKNASYENKKEKIIKLIGEIHEKQN